MGAHALSSSLFSQPTKISHSASPPLPSTYNSTYSALENLNRHHNSVSYNDSLFNRLQAYRADLARYVPSLPNPVPSLKFLVIYDRSILALQMKHFSPVERKHLFSKENALRRQALNKMARRITDLSPKTQN
ncbi:lipase secretion chaperone [Parasalinivibrio latis]|uniref:lipase secretion chaperone n=1 Tax=Parasalinivibrio latis TaxID=2952610 RepID=UPI003DA228BD